MADGSDLEAGRRAIQIARALRDQCAGQPRGMRIGDEGEIATKYRASRRTVRTAVRELEREGILASRKGRYGGLFVNSAPLDRTAQTLSDYITLTDVPVREVAETSMLLYRLAASRAAGCSDAGHAPALHQARELWTAAMRGNRNVDDWCAFRHALVQSAGSPLLTVLQSAFQSAYRDALAAELRLGTLADVRSYPLWELEGHLLRAIEEGDPSQVADAAHAVTGLESRYLGISLSEGLLSRTLRPETLFQNQTMQRSIGGKLSHQTLRALHAHIHVEGFAPGTRLGTLAALAEHFGVGLDVMREAAALAARQNLIEVRSGRSGGIFALDRQSQTLSSIARDLTAITSRSEIIETIAELRSATREHAISVLPEHLLTMSQLIE